MGAMKAPHSRHRLRLRRGCRYSSGRREDGQAIGADKNTTSAEDAPDARALLAMDAVAPN